MESKKNEYIALLGKRDHPTDGLLDYCKYLKDALGKCGINLKIVRVPWAVKGWLQAIHWLWRKAKYWRGMWVLVQYTALQWSRRGFPIGLLAVVWMLRRRKCRVAIVYHDTGCYRGQRFIDCVRRWSQHYVMAQIYRNAERAVSTVPLEKIPWLSNAGKCKIAFVPVGPNVPPHLEERKPGEREKVVAVFCVTGGKNLLREVKDITYAIQYVTPKLFSHGKRCRLVILGRGSREAEQLLNQSLDGSGISVETLGLLPAEEVTRTLSRADVLLFVRSPISTRRGSAIAGIACGLPVVAYAGPETGFPISEAGVHLVPDGDQSRLAKALLEVLTDDDLWQSLHRRSIRAQACYFSWDTIARQILAFLTDGDS